MVNDKWLMVKTLENRPLTILFIVQILTSPPAFLDFTPSNVVILQS